MSDQARWALEYSPRAARALCKLDRVDARRIKTAVERLASLDAPTAPCKALTGELVGLWRLRVGDYRIVLDIRNAEVVIIAVDIGHRSEVY